MTNKKESDTFRVNTISMNLVGLLHREETEEFFNLLRVANIGLHFANIGIKAFKKTVIKKRGN